MRLKDLLPESILRESGLRNIRDLAKLYDEAALYFHMDLDGVTSAIAMREYLEKYGIKVKEVHHIQYGGKEFAADRPEEGRMNVMVDFAHGKPIMHIHTDHHDAQIGVEKGASTKFKEDPSNTQTISQELSPRELFPSKDVELISMIDSAQYAKNKISPEQVIASVFSVNRDTSVERNKTAMALACNKVLLAFKNKPDFLEQVVMQAKPSLISIYTTVKNVIKSMGFDIDDVELRSKEYQQSQQARGVKQLKSPWQIKNLNSGDYAMFGTTLVQYGGGDLYKGGYDRYVPFKLNPTAEFLVMGWPMGLVQASKNPFIDKENPESLNTIAEKVLNKYKHYLENTIISFYYLKKVAERDIWKGKGSEKSFGFTADDLYAQLGDKIKSKPDDMSEIERIADKHFDKLTRAEQDMLKQVTVTAYDVIKSQSGGHHNITNLSGLNILGKDSVEFIKRVMTELAQEMQKIELK